MNAESSEKNLEMLNLRPNNFQSLHFLEIYKKQVLIEACDVACKNLTFEIKPSPRYFYSHVETTK